MKLMNWTGIHSIMLYFWVFQRFFLTLSIASCGWLWVL